MRALAHWVGYTKSLVPKAPGNLLGIFQSFQRKVAQFWSDPTRGVVVTVFQTFS